LRFVFILSESVSPQHCEGKSARFGQKYLEKWLPAFMNIPQLKIDEQDLGG
jgi:hypothetical protein